MSAHTQAPIVWAIGGVDPLNLAGVAADSRGVAVSGAHCATIITCVTGQNSKAFRAKEPMSIAMLDAQWHSLAEQTRPKVIKIGMLSSVAQVKWLSAKLKAQRANDLALRIVYDPVLLASVSSELIDKAMLAAITDFLLPQVDLLTPNIVEASLFAGIAGQVMPIESHGDMLRAAQLISTRHGINVLLKGGHLAQRGDNVQQQCSDCYVGISPALNSRYLSEPVAQFALSSARLSNPNRRGTGCTLASLIAGFVANTYTFGDAIVLAKSVLSQAIKAASPCGNDAGGLTTLQLPSRFEQLPKIMTIKDFVDGQAPLAIAEFLPCPSNLGLYPVVDNCRWLKRLLKLGVKTIQLRVKGLSERDAEPSIVEAIALGKKYHARVFINDYWMLAIKHGAYGVHLGQEDLLEADITQINAAGLRLGLSTHGILEALIADKLAPSYIALGHIFATITKDMPSQPQGVDKLSLQVALLQSRRSLVAIGGIIAARVAPVLATGITSVALVSAITKADDVAGVTQALLRQVGCGADHDLKPLASEPDYG